MKSTEKELFKSLCSFQAESIDEALLRAAGPAVLGHLFFNRMQAIAYGTLKKHELLGKINREFRNSVKGAYEQNLEKNRCFLLCVQYLGEILAGVSCPYAMLKGAYLCPLYPEGYRTSNDIDLLVLPQHVTRIGKTLSDAGFAQGHIRGGTFVPATRKEIIESRMMRGETVPYIKRVGLPGMEYLEVDINFSLDYKSGDEKVLADILGRATVREVKGIRVRTLDRSDFFIHLCSHLYKEATTLPWVEMMRDMTLYKYCDIYMLLNGMCEEDVEGVFRRAREMGMEDICAFAVIQTAALFDVQNAFAIEKARDALKEQPDFIHLVVSPSDKKKFVYTERNIFERFLVAERKELLQEV